MTTQTTLGETNDRKVEGLLEPVWIEVQYKWKGDDKSNLHTDQTSVGSFIGEFVEAEWPYKSECIEKGGDRPHKFEKISILNVLFCISRGTPSYKVPCENSEEIHKEDQSELSSAAQVLEWFITQPTGPSSPNRLQSILLKTSKACSHVTIFLWVHIEIIATVRIHGVVLNRIWLDLIIVLIARGLRIEIALEE